MSRLRLTFTCATLRIVLLVTFGAAARTFPMPPIGPVDASRDTQAKGITRPVPIDMKKAAYPRSAQAKKILRATSCST